MSADARNGPRKYALWMVFWQQIINWLDNSGSHITADRWSIDCLWCTVDCNHGLSPLVN